MDNDIQEATLVESDDKLESETSSISEEEEETAGKEIEKAILIEEEEIDREEEMDKEGEKIDREKEMDEEEEEIDYEREMDEEGEKKSRVMKAKIVDETPEVEGPSRSSIRSADHFKLVAAGIILIIIISAVGIYALRSAESDVVVNVPDLRVGDEARYSVSGKIKIMDADDDPIGDEITSGTIDLKGSSMNVKVEGLTTVTDGFYHEYSALKTTTDTTWNINGMVNTRSYDEVDVTGTVQLSNDAYRNGDTILLSVMDFTANIQARSRNYGMFSKDFNSNDDIRTYSSASGDLQGKLDEVIRQKGLKKGMKGELSAGGQEYSWKVTDNDHVYHTDCVVVEFKVIDPPDDVTYQSLKLYLSNKHPVPVKTVLKLTTTIQGTVIIEYSMKMNNFKRGKGALEIPSDTIIRSSLYGETETMDLYPPTGSRDNTSIGFEIEMAHEKAESESGLDDYLNSHGDAYLVQGIYNETDGPHWNLTYSYPNAEKGYVVLVTESEVEDKGEIPLGEAGTWLEVNSHAPDNVLTWAGAEQVLKHDQEVKNNAFIGERIRLDECNLRVRTRLYQPSVDLVSMFASAPQVDYGYVLVKDHEFAAGVDANTGQLLFVYTHSGDSLF